MDVVRASVIEWEPLRVTLVGVDLDSGELEQFTKVWLARRQKEKLCNCCQKSLQVSPDESRKSIAVFCEWMCDRCLPIYLQQIQQHFEKITQARIGLSAGPEDHGGEPARDGRSLYVAVPEKTVNFEDGTPVQVAPFRIARWAVTAQDFLEFTQATGYRTSAQQQRLSETFLDYPGMSSVAEERSRAPVCCVSFHDATEYCRWKGGVRLPTETEWIAASLVDDRIYDEFTEQDSVWHEGQLRQASLPNALADLGAELTGTEEADGMVVVRFAPQWVRFKDWAECPDENRQRVSKDESRFDVSFRIVLET